MQKSCPKTDCIHYSACTWRDVYPEGCIAYAVNDDPETHVKFQVCAYLCKPCIEDKPVTCPADCPHLEEKAMDNYSEYTVEFTPYCKWFKRWLRRGDAGVLRDRKCNYGEEQ
jgi:hypothetical protein